MNNRKAQAVLFIVVAAVLVLVFVLIFRMLSSISFDDVPEAQQDEVNLIINSVKSCLDRKLHNAIILSGRQGGRIYDISEPFIVYSEYNIKVPLHMDRPSRKVFFYHNHYAPYTCDGSLAKEDPFEPNSLILKQGCSLNTTYYDWNPLFYADSIMRKEDFKYDLFKYMNNTLKECYDFPEEEFNFDILPEENWDLDVQITEDRVLTNIQRDVILRFEDGNTRKISTGIQNFALIRLRKLVDFVHEVVRKDETNLSFRPAAYSKNGFGVSVIRDVEGNNDILRFVDEKSFVDGDKFEIWVGRENLYPIISFLPSKVVEAASGDYVKTTEKVYFNLSDIPQYLPEPVDLAMGFAESCVGGENIEANESLVSYLVGLMSFSDRDEDVLDIEVKTNLSCNENEDFPREFQVNFSVSDGEFKENSTILFKTFAELSS